MDALQDLIPGNHCFGCGPRNKLGLQLKSYSEGDRCVARFMPSPQHNAGPEIWLNGGIIATVIDCHSIFTAIAEIYRREERAVGSEPHIWCVTGSLSVRYLKPAPIDREVRLSGRVTAMDGRKTTVACELRSGEELCASAEVLAIRVDESWKRG